MIFQPDKPHEECGVFGIWNYGRESAARSIYYGLMALQHRGQEAAGIAVCDTYGEKDNLSLKKASGLVSEIFDEKSLSELDGNIGIGHVRYSTTGDSRIGNIQPIAFYYLKGTLALVHNGNIVNADAIKSELAAKGHVFDATSDSEVAAKLIASERAACGSIEEAVINSAPKLRGGYAFIIMSPRKLVAVRDPHGLKPLCLGKTADGYVVASESCAIKSAGAEFIRDIEPGEILTISRKGLQSVHINEKCRTAHCIFEYIYFARLDSVMDGVSIYEARLRGGEALAEAYPVDADIVSGVPESGLAAAQGYARHSGIPYAQVFYKNSYIGRTFIKPTQEEREDAVHLKLSVLADAVKGKRIVLIDDSIVRGTTIRNLIVMLRQAGAREVHVRISSPPFLFPCYYGTDVADTSQLIADRFSIEEIQERIGADSLGYMRTADLKEMVGSLGYCSACFDGDYPVK